MDFRETIKVNNRKTKLVVISYVFIMFVVGILADIAIRPLSNMGLLHDMELYATFQEIPYITVLIMFLTIFGIFMINRFGHKMMLSGSKYQELNPESNLSHEDRVVVNMVEEMAISANLGYTPKVYIMHTDEMNAFAAGWSKSNAIVGVTSGLLSKLNRSEVQAVLAHEIGHIAHGDSKLTLYVGILANVILTVTNIFSNIFILFVGRTDNSNANKARIALILLNFILPIITQVLYLYLSRTREYMADAAAVKLTGDNQAMISALKKISGDYEGKDVKKGYLDDSFTEKYRSAAYIFNKGDSIFSTHPSIENRLEKLGDSVDE